jgi:hypothetical protein
MLVHRVMAAHHQLVQPTSTCAGRARYNPIMRRVLIDPLKAILCRGVLLLAAGTAFGPSPTTYQIRPDKTTMAIGESRSFRMVDGNGQAQHKVRWTLSDVDAFQETEGDELHLYARRTGEFRLTARTDFCDGGSLGQGGGNEGHDAGDDAMALWKRGRMHND